MAGRRRAIAAAAGGQTAAVGQSARSDGERSEGPSVSERLGARHGGWGGSVAPACHAKGVRVKVAPLPWGEGEG
eukprot:6007013-Prymnesium_polylepis.1